MENENEQLVVPPESEREKTEEGHTTSEENEIVSVENAETSGIAAKIAFVVAIVVVFVRAISRFGVRNGARRFH